jgi:hypothetical protein
MDAGELDGNFTSEIRTLSREQLEEVAQLLADRDSKNHAARVKNKGETQRNARM